MSELTDSIWIEKYRPSCFEDLILNDKGTILKYLENPKALPSFIFHSSKPGTGKTSTAKLMISSLNCDSLNINSSDERGIDTIREKIKSFSRSLSSNEDIKRCVFLDEADGLTRQAQDSLRNLMEQYSDNCFFIFTANDVNKIIEPLRSRCQTISFEQPPKADIHVKLMNICQEEGVSIPDDELFKVVNIFFPDIRKMIQKIQEIHIGGEGVIIKEDKFDEFLNLIISKDIKSIYNIVYSGDFEILAFNKWMFHKVFEYHETWFKDFNKGRLIVNRLADTEKFCNLGANLEIVFLSNIVEIMKEL